MNWFQPATVDENKPFLERFRFVDLLKYPPSRTLMGDIVEPSSFFKVLKEKGYLPDIFCVHEKVSDISDVLSAKLVITSKTDATLQFHVSDDLEYQLKDCSHRYLVGYTLVTYGIGAHINGVIIDKQEKIIEIFDPMGYREDTGLTEVEMFADDYLNHPALEDYRLYPMKIFLVYSQHGNKGPQSVQSKFKGELGYCAVWSLIWIHLRMANPGIPRSHLLTYLMQYDPDELLEFVERYMTFVLSLQVATKKLYVSFVKDDNGRWVSTRYASEKKIKPGFRVLSYAPLLEGISKMFGVFDKRKKQSFLV